MISPRMFGQFFLPYMADVSRQFGLIYYGCCEPVHDRWEQDHRGNPERARGVDLALVRPARHRGEAGAQRTSSRANPRPRPSAASNPDWDVLREDLDETLAAARDCNLEIIYRDVYRINGDRARLAKWAQMVRSRIGN